MFIVSIFYLFKWQIKNSNKANENFIIVIINCSTLYFIVILFKFFIFSCNIQSYATIGKVLQYIIIRVIQNCFFIEYTNIQDAVEQVINPINIINPENIANVPSSST